MRSSTTKNMRRMIRGYFARHRVKPGMTGWAQVKGFRGETKTLKKMEARVQYDIYYVENWSLIFRPKDSDDDRGDLPDRTQRLLIFYMQLHGCFFLRRGYLFLQCTIWRQR